jgi:uncharacterized Zn finger protein
LKLMIRRNNDQSRYVPVEERRHKAEKLPQKMRRAGAELSPVTIEGRAIATGVWGRAWCDNLEGFRDYVSRLARGRTDLRHGSVLDLRITPGRVEAMVGGAEVCRVEISVKPMAKTHWLAMCAACAGGIESLADLLEGRLSEAVMQRLCRRGSGLLPRPSDIRFTCSCPEPAPNCKHVAAVLYGVGARLDREPELLFRLRAVDAAELVAGIERPRRQASNGQSRAADSKAAPVAPDMTEAPDRPAPKAEPARKREAPEPKPTASQQDVVDAINALARALGHTVPMLKLPMPKFSVPKPAPNSARARSVRTRSSGSP